MSFRICISASDPVDLIFFRSFVALSLIKNAPIWTKNSLFWVGTDFFSNRGWLVIDCFFMKRVILLSPDRTVWSDTDFLFLIVVNWWSVASVLSAEGFSGILFLGVPDVFLLILETGELKYCLFWIAIRTISEIAIAEIIVSLEFFVLTLFLVSHAVLICASSGMLFSRLLYFCQPALISWGCGSNFLIILSSPRLMI